MVYLNGVEAARFNMPAGGVNYLTTTSNASDDGADFWPAVVPTSLLVEGTNVIAVEIHQTNPTSSDVSFTMDLSGIPYVIRNAYPTVTLTRPTDGTFALAPASFTLSAEASDSDGTVTKVEFFANDTKLGEATQAPYTLTLADVPAGVYVLTAVATDDQAGTQTSAPATHPGRPAQERGALRIPFLPLQTGNGGLKERDEDIICPCRYCDDDVREFGSCYCALYVSSNWNGSRIPHVVVPERRLQKRQ